MRTHFKNLISFEEKESYLGEKRLFFSYLFVIYLVALTFSHLFIKNKLFFLNDPTPQELALQEENEKIYNVLVEQKIITDEVKDEIKALSDKDSAGAGGITEKEGFHTLTKFRELIFGSVASKANPQSKKASREDPLEVSILSDDPIRNKQESQDQQESKDSNPSVNSQASQIPSNYRFQQDFLFRWDGSRALTLATKELVGYLYFKNMLKQIESSFAPPGGGNFAYRDVAGYVVREGIKAGTTKVLFMLNPSGKVVDVKLVSGQGQVMVDNACLDSIRGQNFGPVPEDVKKKGLIFGIQFIFPAFFR